MKTKWAVILTFTILIPFFLITFPYADEVYKKAALASATAWLALADSGKYPETWDQAAVLFKNALNKDQWIASLERGRTPLGKVLSRKLWSNMYTTSLPGAPEGKYVVIMYNTEFENKKSAVETVTPMLDQDGKWRVAGYQIH